MRYLIQPSKKHKHLSYQRRWPTELQDAAKAQGYGKLFTTPTDCPVNASEADKAAAQARGTEAWEKAVALLRVAKSAAGKGVFTYGNGKAAAQLRKKQRHSAMRKAMPKHDVFGLLSLYHEAKPEEGKALAMRQRCWRGFCEAMGTNAAATDKAITSIHDGLDRWQDDMEARGLTGAAIERQRNSVTAVLRWASLRFRIGWQLELRPVAKAPPKPKAVLSVEEQRRLMREVMLTPGPTPGMVMLMLAGGVMPSEIGRLDPEKVKESLGATLPYVVIGGEGQLVKAEARRRVVPVVWPKEVVQMMIECLPEAIARGATTADASAAVNKWLRTRGFTITGHGLRHTMAAMANAAMANPGALAKVGGWSGSGLNPVMLGYGAGAEDTVLVESLTLEVRRWWKHLLPADEGRGLRLVQRA